MKKKVCDGRISSPYGLRINPKTKVAGSMHEGVDIACPVNTPIYTPVNCMIEQEYFHKDGGLTLVIRDIINNDRYAFCHLNAVMYNRGQKVEKGCIIAKSGNTGLSTTGAHLHFTYATGGTWSNGVCHNFKRVDPTEKIEFEI